MKFKDMGPIYFYPLPTTSVSYSNYYHCFILIQGILLAFLQALISTSRILFIVISHLRMSSSYSYLLRSYHIYPSNFSSNVVSSTKTSIIILAWRDLDHLWTLREFCKYHSFAKYMATSIYWLIVLLSFSKAFQFRQYIIWPSHLYNYDIHHTAHFF